MPFRTHKCLAFLLCALSAGLLWGADRESGPSASGRKGAQAARPHEPKVPFASSPIDESAGTRDAIESLAIERLKQEGAAVSGSADPGYRIFITGKTGHDALKHLVGVSHLNWLVLSGEWITDDCLRDLRKFASIRLLTLSTPNVGDRGIQEIASLPSLAALMLRGLRVTDDGLAPLARVASLSSLEITDCNWVHGSGLRILPAIPKLSELFFEDNALDEKELVHLRRCAALYRLVISDGHLTDAAVASLRRLSSNVKSIQLHNTRLTPRAVDDLRKVLPGSEIVVRDLGAGPANLRRIGTALHEYHSVHGSFPPAVLRGPDGKTPYSWRVALLPYLGQQALFERYRFDQPWDSPANRKILEEMPDVYRGPHAPKGVVDSAYYAVTGPKTVFAGSRGVSMSEIRMLTLMVVETKRAIAWTKPEDIFYDEAGPVPKFGGFHADEFNGLIITGDALYFGAPFTNHSERLRPYLSKTYDTDREIRIAAALTGKPAPDFTLKDLLGADVALSKLIAGKVALVSFSAVRCPACRLEAPYLTALHEKFGSQGLIVITVNPWNEDRDLVRDYVSKEKLKHRVLLQGKAVFEFQYGLFEVPTSCWINHRGLIEKINFGFDSQHPQHLFEQAAKLLDDHRRAGT